MLCVISTILSWITCTVEYQPFWRDLVWNNHNVIVTWSGKSTILSWLTVEYQPFCRSWAKSPSRQTVAGWGYVWFFCLPCVGVFVQICEVLRPKRTFATTPHSSHASLVSLNLIQNTASKDEEPRKGAERDVRGQTIRIGDCIYTPLLFSRISLRKNASLVPRNLKPKHY